MPLWDGAVDGGPVPAQVTGRNCEDAARDGTPGTSDLRSAMILI